MGVYAEFLTFLLLFQGKREGEREEEGEREGERKDSFLFSPLFFLSFLFPSTPFRLCLRPDDFYLDGGLSVVTTRSWLWPLGSHRRIQGPSAWVLLQLVLEANCSLSSLSLSSGTTFDPNYGLFRLDCSAEYYNEEDLGDEDRMKREREREREREWVELKEWKVEMELGTEFGERRRGWPWRERKRERERERERGVDRKGEKGRERVGSLY
jgi:hypothetical protein